MKISTCAIVVSVLAATTTHADVVFDEGIGGDLSSDPGAPTAVDLAVGDNSIIGRVRNDPGAPDARDYITFTIEPGELLTGIFLVDWTDDAGADANRGFSHIDDGATSVIPGGDTILDFLGGTHIDRGFFPTNTDNVLSRLSEANEGGVGFVAPLGPGDYTLNIQQTSDIGTNYQFDLRVIPAPAGTTLLAGIAFVATRRRR